MSENLAGKKILNYRIERQLAHGPTCCVYKAQDLTANRAVAVKVLSPELAAERSLVVQFLGEARVAAQVRHANIASVLNAGEAEGQVFAAMEFARGVDLRAILLKRVQLPLNEALSIARRVARALAAAHAKGIIHGNLRLKKILIDGSAGLKVIGFGLSSMSGAEAVGIVGESSQPGAEAYRSPEECQGKKRDERSDIFSLGAILYHMLAGRVPFPGANGNAVVYSIINKAHRPLREVVPGVPEPVARLVDRALAKDPAKRFAKAEEIVTQINAILGEEAQTQAPGMREAREITPMPREKPPAAVESVGSESKKRRIAPVAALACVVVLVVGAIAYFATNRNTGTADAKAGNKAGQASSINIASAAQSKAAKKKLKSGIPSAATAADAGTPDSGDGSSSDANGGAGTDAMPAGDSAADSASTTDSADASASVAAPPQAAGGGRKELAAPSPKRGPQSAQAPKAKPGPPGSSEPSASAGDPAPEASADSAASSATNPVAAAPHDSAKGATETSTSAATPAPAQPSPASPSKSASQASATSEPAAASAAKPQPESRPKIDLSDYIEEAYGAQLQLVWIPGGRFTMGSSEGESLRDDGETPHGVELDGFWIGKFEVTQAEWQKVVESNPSKFNRGGRLPVEGVSWDDAAGFCSKLSQKSGRRYGLPTEAQWEYACRAGSGGAYSFGDSAEGLTTFAWYSRNADETTHEVGTRSPNAWNLYDMHGNVWEWCSDWHSADTYAQSAGKNPAGPAFGSLRVLRGGSWYHYPQNLRAAYRFKAAPTTRNMYVGFRVARIP